MAAVSGQERPRIVFMGTPPFAVASLRACLDIGTVVAVVTQPDKPKGRGQELAISAVKALALEKGLPVLQPQKIRGTSFHEELKALSPDVCVVTAYGKILPRDVLIAPRRGCLNVHASLLPRFRGAAPIQWALASGDSVTGVCLMVMDEGLDTGPVLLRRELPIDRTDTSSSLHDKLSALGGDLIAEGVPRWVRAEIEPTPQPNEGVVLAPMIKKEDGLIDFSRTADELDRRIRAFYPWPGSYVFLEGKMLKVLRARVLKAVHPAGKPGEVLGISDGLAVACGKDALVLQEIQLEGRKAMRAEDFLAGRKVAVGSLPFGGRPS